MLNRKCKDRNLAFHDLGLDIGQKCRMLTSLLMLYVWFQAFNTLHVMYHEATACHVAGEIVDLLTIMLGVLKVARIFISERKGQLWDSFIWNTLRSSNTSRMNFTSWLKGSRVCYSAWLYLYLMTKDVIEGSNVSCRFPQSTIFTKSIYSLLYIITYILSNVIIKWAVQFHWYHNSYFGW